MTSYLPALLTDIGTIASIIGTIISAYLLWIARDIRKSFIRKARLPETIDELTKVSRVIIECIQDLPKSEKEFIRQIIIAKELVDNLSKKLPDIERKKATSFLKITNKKKYFIFTSVIKNADNDKAWELYTSITGLITALEQLKKDSRWD
ncbi:hypothetical protein D3C79_686150 [compost metagenome]